MMFSSPYFQHIDKVDTNPQTLSYTLDWHNKTSVAIWINDTSS
jgi:hypothetical protein